MSSLSDVESTDTRVAVAGYIGKMSAELGRMADASGYTMLSYLLRMATEEAATLGRREAERAADGASGRARQTG